MKKRILSVMLVLAMLLGLCACSKGDTVETIVTEEVIEGESSGSQSSENTDASGDKSGNKGNSTSGDTTVAQKSDKPSSSATGVDGKAVSLANPVYVANGTKAMDEGLDFGGQTFTMAITEETQYSDPQFQRMIASFQKKYNCKIKTVALTFARYAGQVAQAKSAGTPYDIVFMHGSMFPSMAVPDVVCDLTPYMTTADYDTGNGGIDIAKSSYFAIKNNLYGVVNKKNVFPVVIYYNKAMFKKAGLEDPLELYNSNKWTWSKFIEMGKKVTDAGNGVYFGNQEFYNRWTVNSYGVSMSTYANGKMVLNEDNANVQKGLKLVASLCNTYKICEPYLANGAKHETFLAGTSYCTIEESSKFQEIAKQVDTSAALNHDISNIGIVPIPQDTASAKRGYSCGWYTAICAGAGSKDPRVAVAFAKFQSTYVDVANDTYELNQEQQALCDKLISGPIANPHGAFGISSDDMEKTHYMDTLIVGDVVRGKDLAQTVATYIEKMKNVAKEQGFY